MYVRETKSKFYQIFFSTPVEGNSTDMTVHKVCFTIHLADIMFHAIIKLDADLIIE